MGGPHGTGRVSGAERPLARRWHATGTHPSSQVCASCAVPRALSIPQLARLAPGCALPRSLDGREALVLVHGWAGSTGTGPWLGGARRDWRGGRMLGGARWLSRLWRREEEAGVWLSYGGGGLAIVWSEGWEVCERRATRARAVRVARVTRARRVVGGMARGRRVALWGTREGGWCVCAWRTRACIVAEARAPLVPSRPRSLSWEGASARSAFLSVAGMARARGGARSCRAPAAWRCGADELRLRHRQRLAVRPMARGWALVYCRLAGMLEGAWAQTR